MSKNKSLDYTCIFGGGAIRGVSYAGALKALEEIGIRPSTIAGSSVGAVFAALIAVGYSADEMRDVFMKVNFELFKDIHFGFGNGFALSKGEIFLDWLRELIEKKFYGERYKKGENPPVTFADLDANFIAITTDLTNFKYKEFSKFETPDAEIAYAVRTSSTMPGLMTPAEYNGTLLVDGDLQKSWPLWRLSKNLCLDEERVLEFRLEGDYQGKGQNPLNFMNTVYSCVTSLATDFIIDTYGNRDKFDYIKINTGSIIIVDFNISSDKREELMDLGYRQTLDYFNSILPDKKKTLLNHYKELFKKIEKVKNNIFANKIKKAYDKIGLLYMNLYHSKRFIDLKYCNLIDEFIETFFNNILPTSLFGIYSLRNSTLIKSQIESIHKQLQDKVTELEDYIFKLKN